MALCVLCMTLCMLVQSSIYRSYAALVSEQQQAIYIFQCRDFALRWAGLFEPFSSLSDGLYDHSLYATSYSCTYVGLQGSNKNSQGQGGMER